MVTIRKSNDIPYVSSEFIVNGKKYIAHVTKVSFQQTLVCVRLWLTDEKYHPLKASTVYQTKKGIIPIIPDIIGKNLSYFVVDRFNLIENIGYGDPSVHIGLTPIFEQGENNIENSFIILGICFSRTLSTLSKYEFKSVLKEYPHRLLEVYVDTMKKQLEIKSQ